MKIHSQKTVQKKIIDLIPYERNPNIHPTYQIEQLKNSIREWGYTIPIVIDENDTVLAGHGRLFAVQELGMDEVPCIIVEGWTDQQKQAYVIADNKLSEGSDWDMNLFYQELKALNDTGFNIELTGFDENISLDFAPNLNPSANFSDVNQSDVDKAGQLLSDNMKDLSGNRAQRGVEVMCPYCAESFTFDGI